MTTIDRVAILEEAIAIERVGGDWSVRHVCAVLDCHKTTLYRTPWLRARLIDGPGGKLIHPSDVRLYQQNRQGIIRPTRRKVG